ncbi:hypothetical protein HHI36_000662 [Cryptolaemus montrouzieri]|uniref:Uncharacterized protein n=1 Tax=Cryptolaemus montrouzieri TaxID=559131 RepID=A0ABD2P5E5_9CUCU
MCEYTPGDRVSLKELRFKKLKLTELIQLSLTRLISFTRSMELVSEIQDIICATRPLGCSGRAARQPSIFIYITIIAAFSCHESWKKGLHVINNSCYLTLILFWRDENT